MLIVLFFIVFVLIIQRQQQKLSKVKKLSEEQKLSDEQKLAAAKRLSAEQKLAELLKLPDELRGANLLELLAELPNFNVKPKRRTNKKLSTAAQIEQTREGCIDLETPDSILVSFNLRDLLNKDTFNALPTLYQLKLIQSLPDVDRPTINKDTKFIRLNSSSLTNEFFTRACLEWKERLADGEFTPENQLKLRTEAEKEKSKLDPWKLKHFEPIWGAKSTDLPIDTTRRVSKTRRNNVTKTKSTTNTTPSSSSSSSSKSTPTVTVTTAKETAKLLDKIPPDVKVKRTPQLPAPAPIVSTQSTVKNAEMKNNKNDLTLRSRPVVSSYQTVQQTSSTDNKQTISKVEQSHPERPSLKTTISFKTIRDSHQQSQDIPVPASSASSASNNYTTSSGRIVKNPNNYPIIGTNSLQSQKRVRIGAVTRSLISTSTTSSNNSLKIGENHSQTSVKPSNSIQNSDKLTTVKVIGPTIMPITTTSIKTENFTKVPFDSNHFNNSLNFMNFAIFTESLFPEKPSFSENSIKFNDIFGINSPWKKFNREKLRYSNFSK